MSDTAAYFTANIKVEKIVPPGRAGTRDAALSRRKGEVTNLTVRASTMDRLKEKLSAHIALIDDDAVDTGEEGPTR